MPRATKSTTKTGACTCLVCGKAFRRNFDLNRHLATHDPQVDRLKAECPYEGCTFKTLQQSNLKTHIIAKHLKLRPHKCTIGGCTLSFADMSTLIRHEKNVHDHHRSSPSTVPKYSRKKPVVKLEDVDFALTMPQSTRSTPGLSDAGSSSGSLSPFPPSPSMFGMHIPSQSSADTLSEGSQYCASNFPNFYPDIAFWSSQQPFESLFVPEQQQFQAIDSNTMSSGCLGFNALDWMNELVSPSPSYSSDAWSFMYPAGAELSDQGSSIGWSSI